MSSQTTPPALSDASRSTRSKSGILTPASDHGSPDYEGRSEESASVPRKMKSSVNGAIGEDLLRESFVIKPFPSTAYLRPRNLQPLILLPRSRLSLSFLDIHASVGPLPQSRLFEAQCKILELEQRMGNEPVVLIALLDDGQTCYAVERESKGLYVLCKLGPWVELESLKEAGIVCRHDLLRPRSARKPSEIAKTQTTEAYVTPEEHKYNKKKREAMEALQSMVKRPSTSHGERRDSQVGSQAATPTESQPAAETQPLPEELPPMDIEPKQQTAEEIFENLRTQYFEALYVSKTSLAYFAKGPLSRARAPFHLDYDSTLEMSDLKNFLEGLVLSPTNLDKKYKTGVPETVSNLDLVDSDAEVPVKKHRTKKFKLGKNGLYPREDEYVQKWWKTHNCDADREALMMTRDQITKLMISQLRIRETQLQMIVILEVLALRTIVTAQPAKDAGLPSMGAAPGPAAKPEEKDKPKKSKKAQDLPTLLDLYGDRLSIWQSTAEDAAPNPAADSQNAQALTSTESRAADILHDYCVEVIMPFFSARLPELCQSINRKLGGPVAPTPPRSKPIKSFTAGISSTRPGAATKRPLPSDSASNPKASKIPRRSLSRVLTDERARNARSTSREPSRAIERMHRSQSAVIPGLKREHSETPLRELYNIPVAKMASREVDFSNVRPMSRSVSDSKFKKSKLGKPDVDKELKDAISLLKKPNRELAGRTFAEAVEKRGVGGRKVKKPVRNPLFDRTGFGKPGSPAAGVQVAATPRKGRNYGAGQSFGGMSQPMFLKETPRKEVMGVEETPIKRRESQDFSAPFPKMGSLAQPQTTRQDPTETWGVEATPVKRKGSQGRAENMQKMPTMRLPEPMGETYGTIQETPVKKRQPSFQGFGAGGNDMVASTPVRAEKTNKGMVSNTATDKPASQPQEEEDVYKALGWDDADDMVF